MFGFEEDAPTPAVVARCGQVFAQPGRSRPDGGPATEVMEVRPVLPGTVEAPEGTGCDLPRPGPTRAEREAACRKLNARLKRIQRRAMKLAAAMKEYVRTYSSDDPCGCAYCDWHHSTMSIIGDLEAHTYMAHLVADLANQFVRGDGFQFGPLK